MPESNIQTAIDTALQVASFVEQLASGVVLTEPNADARLKSENIFQRKTYASRNIQHLKRLMTQTWFTDALTMEQFTAINNAIVAGEDYLD
jgi:hypothetical protein